MTRSRLVGCVLLPFAAGYYLSYLFRTINALIATDLTAELGLGAADLGLLTSVYFLVFAAAQLPFGVLLDRHGPRTIQSVLLLLASAGALVFALADSLTGLIVGRAVIGLGVALALMAGFKAIVLWFPPERVALVNGWFVMLGALGAVTATAPAEVVVQVVGWRGLFALLGGLSAVAAILVLLLVPDCCLPKPKNGRRPLGLGAIYCDRRFWRLAPLSALGVGTSWSLQGLWAAPWLKDVDGLDRGGVVHMLGIMAIAVSASGLLLGLAADRLRRHGIKTHQVLAATLGVSMLAQMVLVLGWAVPALLPWALIAAAGAATVLSYATLAEYFPKEASGRANAALNILHVGSAFAIQCATGLVIEQWPPVQDHYPVEAHRCAMAIMLMLQAVALSWFCLAARHKPLAHYRQTLQSQLAHYTREHGSYGRAPSQLRMPVPVSSNGWRAATVTAMLISMVLLGCLTLASGHAGIAAHVIQSSR
ncbi:MAG: MFS transporter [Hyphomonadaceae bacterium]|nr:MFS transporter [Hyphomonadaceae bacterium]